MKNRINFIDILIIILFAVAVISAIWKINSNISEKFSEETRYDFYNIVFEGTVDSDYADSITAGQTVLDLNSGIIIGSVSSVEFSDYVLTNSLMGAEIKSENTMNISVSVYANIHGKNNKDGIDLPPYVIGEKYPIALPGVAFDGICTSLKSEDSSENVTDIGRAITE